MDEFCEKEQMLQNNKNGYFLTKNVGLYHYKYRYNEWKEIEERKERKRKTFTELVDNPKYSSPDKCDNGTSYHRHSTTNHSTSYDQHSNNSSHQSYGSNNRTKDFDNGHSSSNFKRPSNRQSPYLSYKAKY